MKKLSTLPFKVNLNTTDILKKLNKANNSIGKLKGLVNILPNSDLILSLINVSESKDSSAIENIKLHMKISIKIWYLKQLLAKLQRKSLIIRKLSNMGIKI